MAYFPFYIDIKDKKCIIVGGGIVALRKIEKLIPFEPEITVIAPEICNEILKLDGIKIIRRKFTDNDIDSAFFVISATDDEKVNAHIFELCSKKNILVNTVDNKKKCSFIFPAIVHKNDITVGVTTSGKSPLYAQYLKNEICSIIDEDKTDVVEILGNYRPIIKKEIQSEELRKTAFKRILDMCIKNNKAPTEKQIFDLIGELKNNYEN